MRSYVTTPAKKPGKYKARKIILSVLLVLVLLLTAGWLYWNSRKKEIIRTKLENAIEEKTAGVYKIDYDDMELDELAGDLTLMNMRIGYDSSRYDSMTKLGKTPSMLFKMKIPVFSVSGVKTKKALKGKEFIGRKLFITQPEIVIIYTGKGEQPDRNIPGNEIYRELLGNLEIIQLDTVEIRDARIVTYNLKSKRDSLVLHHSNILLSDLRVDSIGNEDKSRILFSKTVAFNCEKVNWRARTGLYKYGMTGISMNSGDNTIHIDKVDIDPQMGEAAFVKSQRYQTDRFNIHFQDIRFAGVDFSRVMDEALVADRMEVGATTVKAYRDLNIPRDNKNRSGTYPHQAFVRLPVDMNIKQAFFPMTNIEYKEVSDISGKAGVVQFNQCAIRITNLTNDEYFLKKNNTCRIEVDGKLMSLTPMHATLTVPLGDPQGRFHIEGTTGGTDARNLNQLTEPMGMARIRDGNVESLHYIVDGDNTHATGKITVKYEDLKIDFLEFDNDKASGIDKKDFTSFVANVFIKDNNPGNSGLRTAEVNHARDMNRSFYNLVWKTIFEGINLSIGNKKKMKRP